MRISSLLFWSSTAVAIAVFVFAALFALQPREHVALAETPAIATGPAAPGLAVQAPVLSASAAASSAAASSTAQDAQITALLEARRAEYQAQLDELAHRVQLGQTALNAVTQEEQALTQQLAQLQQQRDERRNAYAGQVATAKQTYADRLAQLQAQLQEAQKRLQEANTQLGR